VAAFFSVTEVALSAAVKGPTKWPGTDSFFAMVAFPVFAGLSAFQTKSPPSRPRIALLAFFPIQA
jgi:hypothetical protein